MGKILYLECNSGISGDMTVGMLLDLGADRKVLVKALDSMQLDGYHLHFGRKETCGLDAFDFDVHLEADGHSHEKNEHNDHEKAHHHGEAHTHGEAHHHTHRNLYDIYEIIDRLNTGERVKELARKMFRIVAEAEAKAHGLPVEQVHFHEVGAIDSIIDIVSVAICIDNLGIEEVVVSPLSEGHGHVHCQHGTLPVPVPATANIISAWGLELRFTDNEGEMVTPTGAAIAAALRTRKELPDACRLLKIGMGAGNKVFRQANVLRGMLLETEDSKVSETKLWVMETNLDDSTGEMLGLTMEMLLEAGAADVWYTPVYMKKNRPGYQLSVLCKETDRELLEDILMTQSTTIGIRRYPVQRTVLEREMKMVKTPYGIVEIKICRHKDKFFFYPEYESIRRICKETGADFQNVYYEARRVAEAECHSQSLC